MYGSSISRALTLLPLALAVAPSPQQLGTISILAADDLVSEYPFAAKSNLMN